MRTEMVIRMQASSEKGHSKALKVAAETEGVESVTLAGKDRSLLVVVGDGVDCNHLTSRLRRKVGHADVVELRTLHGGDYYAAPRAARDTGGGYGYATPSYAPASEYYHDRPHAPTTVVHHEYYPAATAGDPSGCSIM